MRLAFTLILLCLIPLPLTRSVMTLFSALITGAVAALPFFFTGVATTIALTRTPLSVSRLYAADLAGAAIGCVMGLLALESVDTPSAVLLSGAAAFLAAAAFLPAPGSSRARTWCVAAFVVAAGLGALNTTSVSQPRGSWPVTVCSATPAS